MMTVCTSTLSETPQRLHTLPRRISTPVAPKSGWCNNDFVLGAGMVIIQQNTHKIVVVTREKATTNMRKHWFFPRGRKDRGETLEQAALREAHEESGYKASFLPVYSPTRQPAPPHDIDAYNRPDTEPIFMTAMPWKALNANDKHEGQYLTAWYIGQISEDTVPDENTKMENESDYITHLLSYEEARMKLDRGEATILDFAWELYVRTVEIERKELEFLGDIARKGHEIINRAM